MTNGKKLIELSFLLHSCIFRLEKIQSLLAQLYYPTRLQAKIDF